MANTHRPTEISEELPPVFSRPDIFTAVVAEQRGQPTLHCSSMQVCPDLQTAPILPRDPQQGRITENVCANKNMHPHCLQAEHLKRELLTKIAETKAKCEATIENKAQQLTSALESVDRCPCATSTSQW